MSTFEEGTSYWTRSISDHSVIVSITVQARSAKTIRIKGGKTLRIFDLDGAEAVRPWGNYSMCPIISAVDRGPLPA